MNSLRPDLKVGDLMTAYHSGYHRAIKIYTDKRGIDLVDYIQVLTASGKKSRKNKKTCHINYCTPITKSDIQEMYEQDIKEAEMKRSNVLIEVDNE